MVNPKWQTLHIFVFVNSVIKEKNRIYFLFLGMECLSMISTIFADKNNIFFFQKKGVTNLLVNQHGILSYLLPFLCLFP